MIKRIMLLGIVVGINCFSIIYPQDMLININKGIIEKNLIVDKSFEESSEYLKVSVKIPQIIGLNNKEREREINNEIIEFTNNFVEENRIASEANRPGVPYESFVTYRVTNEEKILSFYIDYYQYSGGAHGITIRKTYNIDITTGQNVELKDLFKEGFDYKEYINKEIQSQISINKEDYFPGKEGFTGIKDNQAFYIENGYIVIHFAYYEIAPYVAGMPQFKIPYNALENYKDV
ncbi:DUF3298 and DUF4163 domain-containing protein [Clostridium isatidis]|uniref:Deacetylase PdaC domain-containing protein n=1 Tax=Clostridium isatidis TaxID=182773 RepID=A0A343J9Q8_9CLOT|nr:DUF3298 and DUF4163 domain-containing protein [Clostridium isatidis]ASW42266.1 hypothetical protein BEN51_01810 [Clostridium isatidis]